MRLTIVNSGAPGTISLLRPFFEALAADGAVELTVIEHAPPGENHHFAPRLEGYNGGSYVFQPVPARFYHRRHAALQLLDGRFRKLLADSRPEIIYILGEAGYLSTFQIVWFARKLPKVRICLFGAQNIYQRYPPPFPQIESYVLRRIDHAFPLGEDHEEVLRRKGYQGPATHLPLGVDTQHFTPGDADSHFEPGLPPRPIIGFVGDFLPARNLPLLIEAVGRCSQKMGLLIVGDGPSRDSLEQLVAERNLKERVIFTGRISHAEMPHYLNIIDLLVLPSTPVANRRFGVFRLANAEQFGRVLIEAMACGKPVVGSSCGEIPKVIADCGLVFPDGDADVLAACLDQLGEDTTLRARLGHLGRRRACDYYDWKILAKKFLTALNS